MRSAGQLALTVVALGAAFATGALAYYQFGHKRDSAPQAAVTASEVMAEAPKPAIPDMLPDFTLKDLQGRPHSIREWAGRPLVINFWATWCGPCLQEMPLLERLREERKGDGVEIVGIAVDFKADVQAFVAKHPISYPILERRRRWRAGGRRSWGGRPRAAVFGFRRSSREDSGATSWPAPRRARQGHPRCTPRSGYGQIGASPSQGPCCGWPTRNQTCRKSCTPGKYGIIRARRAR